MYSEFIIQRLNNLGQHFKICLLFCCFRPRSVCISFLLTHHWWSMFLFVCFLVSSKENYSTCDDTNANLTQDTVCNNKQGQTQRPLASNCESQSGLTMAGSYSNRQAKHKLLDHIADPPPLAPLPSPIPASVRREFQRPKRVGSSVKLSLEQWRSRD